MESKQVWKQIVQMVVIGGILLFILFSYGLAWRTIFEDHQNESLENKVQELTYKNWELQQLLLKKEAR